ncbi:MAG: S-methyl-5'-thioadenosine phosphorylase [Bdellovibrionota bacterium]
MSAGTIGIIGGTGLYSLPGLEDVEQIELDTPFGKPSSPITSGRLGETRLLFLARHGIGHKILPTEINSQANIYALKTLGAEWCLSISAVGSLQEELAPGDIVVPDQLIDRTRLRENTFFGEGVVAHVQFADPFCPVLSDALYQTAARLGHAGGIAVQRGGTYVCMEGPAFSTRAESHLYRSFGASLIGMTALPEAKLAREAEIAYAVLALVTDYDCWRSHAADVDVAEILRIMGKNVEFARSVIQHLVPSLKNVRPSSMAADALQAAIITPKELWPAPTKVKLRALLDRYLV